MTSCVREWLQLLGDPSKGKRTGRLRPMGRSTSIADWARTNLGPFLSEANLSCMQRILEKTGEVRGTVAAAMELLKEEPLAARTFGLLSNLAADAVLVLASDGLQGFDLYSLVMAIEGEESPAPASRATLRALSLRCESRRWLIDSLHRLNREFGRVGSLIGRKPRSHTAFQTIMTRVLRTWIALLYICVSGVWFVAVAMER